MTISPTRETLRKLNDRRSLFVIAALSIALISAVFRLFAEPGRPAIAIAADVAIIALVAVINVFSIIVVIRASKAIMTEGEFADVRRAAYNLKHPNDAKRPNTVDVTFEGGKLVGGEPYHDPSITGRNY